MRQDLSSARTQVTSLTEQLAQSKAEVARLKSAKMRALTALGLEAGWSEVPTPMPSPNATQHQ